MNRKSRGERGFVLVLMALMAIVMVGVLGLSVDLGRMYIARHEAQVYTVKGGVKLDHWGGERIDHFLVS
jgi:hypothetical protein